MKNWVYSLLVAALTALVPIKSILISVGVLIMADLITGVWAAIKKKEKVSSAKLRNTVSKSFIYLIAIICGYLVEHFIVSDAIPISKLLSGVIGLVELKSILENLNFIYGGDLFKAAIQYLGSSNLPINQELQPVAQEIEKEAENVGQNKL